MSSVNLTKSVPPDDSSWGAPLEVTLHHSNRTKCYTAWQHQPIESLKLQIYLDPPVEAPTPPPSACALHFSDTLIRHGETLQQHGVAAGAVLVLDCPEPSRLNLTQQGNDTTHSVPVWPSETIVDMRNRVMRSLLAQKQLTLPTQTRWEDWEDGLAAAEAHQVVLHSCWRVVLADGTWTPLDDFPDQMMTAGISADASFVLVSPPTPLYRARDSSADFWTWENTGSCVGAYRYIGEFERESKFRLHYVAAARDVIEELLLLAAHKVQQTDTTFACMPCIRCIEHEAAVKMLNLVRNSATQIVERDALRVVGMDTTC